MTTVLTVLLSNVVLASWLKPDWLHRLASIGAKPKGKGGPQLTQRAEDWVAITERRMDALANPDRPRVRPAAPDWQTPTYELDTVTRHLDLESVS